MTYVNIDDCRNEFERARKPGAFESWALKWARPLVEEIEMLRRKNAEHLRAIDHIQERSVLEEDDGK